jgi:hypothetical protein
MDCLQLRNYFCFEVCLGNSWSFRHRDLKTRKMVQVLMVFLSSPEKLRFEIKKARGERPPADSSFGKIVASVCLLTSSEFLQMS